MVNRRPSSKVQLKVEGDGAGRERSGRTTLPSGPLPMTVRGEDSWCSLQHCSAPTTSGRDTEGLLVGWLLNVPATSQGRICSGSFTCCHTEIEVADQTSHLTQSQYTDTGPTSPSTEPVTPGAWQGSHWSTNF